MGYIPDPGRTALYRYYDRKGELLYIGISSNPDLRLKQHTWTYSKWVRLARERRIEWFDTRVEAEAAEVAAIKAEKPRFNGAHNFVDAAFTPEVWSPPVTEWRKRDVIEARIRAEIASGNWAPGMKIPTCGEMAAAAKVSKKTATFAVTLLIREGLLTMQGGRGVFVEPCDPET